jgi:hypothetical protein
MLQNKIIPVSLQKNLIKKISVSGNQLTIGATSGEIWADTEHKSKVPHVLFYDIQQVSLKRS